MPDKRIRKVCKKCGSEDVKFDAYTVWNFKEQRMEVAMISDDGHVCEDCDGPCRIIDVPVEEEEIISVPIYNQNCTLAGKRCWDEDMIENESGDIHIFKGTREELLDTAGDYECKPNNSNGLYWWRVAKTIREELE